jgi:hypothetical protein
MKLESFRYFPPSRAMAEYFEGLAEDPLSVGPTAGDQFVPWHGFGPGYGETYP